MARRRWRRARHALTTMPPFSLLSRRQTPELSGAPVAPPAASPAPTLRSARCDLSRGPPRYAPPTLISRTRPPRHVRHPGGSDAEVDLTGGGRGGFDVSGHRFVPTSATNSGGRFIAADGFSLGLSVARFLPPGGARGADARDHRRVNGRDPHAGPTGRHAPHSPAAARGRIIAKHAPRGSRGS